MSRKPRVNGFRKIRIIETGEVFNSINDMVEAKGFDKTGVSKVLNGHREHHMGYTFALAGKSDPIRLPLGPKVPIHNNYNPERQRES